MEMFNDTTTEKRIGKSIAKSEHLSPLKEVEAYFLEAVEKYDFEASYDVMAYEIPYFQTLCYTEYAHCFIIHPLCPELRVKQINDAALDNSSNIVDFAEFFRNKLIDGTANKYSDRKSANDFEKRKHLIVLAGSNKLKSRICLNKLKHIHKSYGKDVWFKPHPLTKHALIGEMKDIFGEDAILPRDTDLYSFLHAAKVVHTTHLSESAVYAVSAGKTIDPIDVFQGMEMSSFYHINRYLFTEENPIEWVNKTFSNPKSGIINPLVDGDWKNKIDMYLEYINTIRESYKGKYIAKPKKKEVKKD